MNFGTSLISRVQSPSSRRHFLGHSPLGSMIGLSVTRCRPAMLQHFMRSGLPTPGPSMAALLLARLVCARIFVTFFCAFYPIISNNVTVGDTQPFSGHNGPQSFTPCRPVALYPCGGEDGCLIVHPAHGFHFPFLGLGMKSLVAPRAWDP